jgi:iron complex outermembrane receptor protein
MTFNLNAGYKMNENVSFVMGVTNLLNTKQVEFVGSPSIGRLVSFEIKVHVPESKKKQAKAG